MKKVFLKIFGFNRRKSKTLTNKELKYVKKALERFVAENELDLDGDVVGLWFNLIIGQVELYNWAKPMNKEENHEG